MKVKSSQMKSAWVLTHTRDNAKESYIFDTIQEAMRKKQNILIDYLYSGDSDISSQDFTHNNAGLKRLESFLVDFNVYIYITEEIAF